VIHKVIHKYLFKRNQTYYFRWRVYAELQAVFKLKEIRFSLRTQFLSVAYARASEWLEFVQNAKISKNAYVYSETNRDDFFNFMNKKLVQIQSNTNKQADSDNEMQLTRFFYADGSYAEFDYNGDIEKESEAMARFTQKESPKFDSSVLLSELFTKFLAHKIKITNLNVRMQKAYQLYIRTIIELIGDKQIASISREDVRDMLQDYKSLPKRNLKLYKNISVSELLEMEILAEHKLSDKSVLDVQKFLQGLFTYAQDSKLIESSPARNLKMGFSAEETYAKFEDSEVVKILTHSANQKQKWRKWVCWLAAYSGARLGEVVQLRKEDIKKDDESQRFYLHITDKAGSVKNKNAIRQVPIHQKLIDDGFLKYVQEGEGGRLFKDLNAQTVTQWFINFKKELDIPLRDDYGQRKVFHSFRHSFITKSRVSNLVDKVQQVVGHEKVFAGQTDRYTHRYKLQEVLEVVDKVSFKSTL
jgi:integrase